MRKRSEAMSVAAVIERGKEFVSDKQMALFPKVELGEVKTGESKPSFDVPSNVTVVDGTVYVKCPDCGLNGSTMTCLRVNDALLCLRCKAHVDLDNVLTLERIGELKKLGTTPNAFTNPSVPIVESKTIPVPPPKVLAPDPLRNHPPFPVTEVAATAKDSRIANATGDKIVVTYGEETFSPVSYNTFRVGPFSVETTVREGETMEQALERAHKSLATFAAIEFTRKAAEFNSKLSTMTRSK